MNRRTICIARGLCNGALVALSLTAPASCKEDPAPVAATGADLEAPTKKSDAEVVDLPLSPAKVMASLPAPPAPAGARPGDPLSALRDRQPELSTSPLSSRLLHQRPQDGPFREIIYLLEPDPAPDADPSAPEPAPPPMRVKAVQLTFAHPYTSTTSWRRLQSEAQARLGEGELQDNPPYRARIWSVEGYRIELRRDSVTGDGELLFHVRGARELDLP